MGLYIKYFDKFEKSKFTRIKDIKGKKYCYIHLTILKEALKGAIETGYEILGWEAMIITEKGTLSPVELVIGTGPETDKKTRNKNALERDYRYFVNTIEKRSNDGEYRKEDIFVDLSIKK